MESRRITFRAWNKDDKKMIYGAEYTYDYVHPEGIAEESFGGLLQNENYIVMQFTGLKDKNSNNIFEGDICVYIDDGEKKKGFVRFDGGRFEIGKHNGYGGDWDDLGMLLHSYWNNKEAQNSLEVIGNIYENKELLENEDE